MDEKSGDLFTDLVLELLTAYLLSNSNESRNLTMKVMDSVRSDDKFLESGFLEGMVFSSILHLSMMINYISLVTGKSNEEVLKRYALVYQMTKETIAKMPQVHPEFVAKIAEEFGGLY